MRPTFDISRGHGTVTVCEENNEKTSVEKKNDKSVVIVDRREREFTFLLSAVFGYLEASEVRDYDFPFDFELQS